MEVEERRRRTTLSEQLSAAAAKLSTSSSSSLNLRELLNVRQEEDLYLEQQACGRRSARVPLGSFLACEKRELSSRDLTAVPAAVGSRTLLDVMRDEEEPAAADGVVYSGVVIDSRNGGHNISWRAFRERLRVRRSSAAWQSAGGAGNPLGEISAAGLIVASTAVAPSSRIPMPEDNAVRAGVVAEHNRTSSTVSSARAAAEASPQSPTPAAAVNSPTRAAEAPDAQAEGSGVAGVTQQQPEQIRVSLMALLEQTDRLGDGGRPGFAVSALLGPAVVEEEEEEEEGDAGGLRGKMYVKCCVCMVRRKGAAFIPCGHTFCRLCSRELWVARGSCPLCNGFILEILDIF